MNLRLLRHSAGCDPIESSVNYSLSFSEVFVFKKAQIRISKKVFFFQLCVSKLYLPKYFDFSLAIFQLKLRYSKLLANKENQYIQ